MSPASIASGVNETWLAPRGLEFRNPTTGYFEILIGNGVAAPHMGPAGVVIVGPAGKGRARHDEHFVLFKKFLRKRFRIESRSRDVHECEE